LHVLKHRLNSKEEDEIKKAIQLSLQTQKYSSLLFDCPLSSNETYDELK
jgi:hypothetical protein